MHWTLPESVLGPGPGEAKIERWAGIDDDGDVGAGRDIEADAKRGRLGV